MGGKVPGPRDSEMHGSKCKVGKAVRPVPVKVVGTLPSGWMVGVLLVMD